MKCPECDYDQKVKYGLTCGGCGYVFTFNPKTEKSRLTDGKFVGCIRSASQNGTMWFTRNQLYAAYCRRLTPAVWPRRIGIGLALLGTLLAGFGGAWPIAIFMAVVTGILSLSLLFDRGATDRQRFEERLGRWMKDEKPVDMLLQTPSLDKPPPEWSEPDIYDYGVERILIVEHDILVDLFVKNGLHAEQRMLVLAESGYPHYLLPVAERLLNESVDLPVFLLHDATPHGVQMADRLQKSRLLPLRSDTLVDIGLFPEDFKHLKRTRNFDPDNTERQLPCDALMLPFLALGLGATFSQGIPMSTLLAQQQQQSMADSGTSMDFG